MTTKAENFYDWLDTMSEDQRDEMGLDPHNFARLAWEAGLAAGQEQERKAAANRRAFQDAMMD